MAHVLHQPDWNRTFDAILDRMNKYAEESQEDFERLSGPGRFGRGGSGPIRDFLRNIGEITRTRTRAHFGLPPMEADVERLYPGWGNITGSATLYEPNATEPRTFSTGMTPARNGMEPKMVRGDVRNYLTDNAPIGRVQRLSNAAILRQRQREQWQQQRPQRQQYLSNAAILRRRQREQGIA